MSTLHREDAAYLAGLLDGEGCFDAPGGNPRIRVKMTDFDVVFRAADLMGATTYVEPGNIHRWHSDLLVAQTTGDNAVRVMREILPWMGSRRSAKITEIVTAQAAKQKAKRSKVRTLVVAPIVPLRAA